MKSREDIEAMTGAAEFIGSGPCERDDESAKVEKGQ
jgi:hypothetical protein